MKGVVQGVLLFVVGVLLMGPGTAAVLGLTMKPYRTPSSAMEPALHCPVPGAGCAADTADRILVLRFTPFWTPKRGDIVAFETPEAALLKCGAGGTFIKRLIALPGDSWEQRAGTVYINGQRLSEPYVKPGRADTQSYPTRSIPEDRYFIMGDNRTQSCDSREFGSVPRDNLLGPVVARYWPLDRIGSP